MSDTANDHIDPFELDRDELVDFLLRTKKQIQHLADLANCKPDIAEIQVYLRSICIHEKVWDSFDIDPDTSATIEYCPKCETIFNK